MARFAWIARLSFPGLVASISMASSSRRRKLLELELQRMRNAALTEKLMQKIPSWQRASAEKVLMKAKVQAAKEPSTSLTITIPAVSNYEEQDILVVRPKYDHEELRVELTRRKLLTS